MIVKIATYKAEKTAVVELAKGNNMNSEDSVEKWNNEYECTVQHLIAECDDSDIDLDEVLGLDAFMLIDIGEDQDSTDEDEPEEEGTIDLTTPDASTAQIASTSNAAMISYSRKKSSGK